MIYLLFKLNEISQDWANKLAKTDNASHRPNNEYGENIYIIMSKHEVTEVGVKAVDYWYSEVKYFNFQQTEREMSASKNACNVSILNNFNYIFCTMCQVKYLVKSDFCKIHFLS